MSQIYRQTVVGLMLQESVRELQDSGKIDDEAAEKIMEQFDLSILKAFRDKIPAKASIKGNLITYNYIDSVWQMELEDVELRLNPAGVGSIQQYAPVLVDKAKIVCVDAKLLDQTDD